MEAAESRGGAKLAHWIPAVTLEQQRVLTFSFEILCAACRTLPVAGEKETSSGAGSCEGSLTMKRERPRETVSACAPAVSK